jgi:hypothetical protein
MKVSIRLAAVAVSAVAFAAIAGAQQRASGHGGAARPSGGHPQQARQASRSQSQGVARQNVREQRYAAHAAPRAEFRGRTDFAARSDARGRAADARARVDVRGRDSYRPVAVAEHNRPLITRSGMVTPRGFERPAAFRGARFGPGFNRWGGRLVLPVGWGSRVVFGGFFPVAYAGYCEAVPYDYDYLLPPMAPSYDPCLFGDRVVVYDRFSRSIVFVAAL